MPDFSHKDCQVLIGLFVKIPQHTKAEANRFWKAEISFAKKILQSNPDIRFWRFAASQMTGEKRMSSLLWLLSENGISFAKSLEKPYKTFLFDFPQPKTYTLSEDKIGEDLKIERSYEKKSILYFLRKDYGKKT